MRHLTVLALGLALLLPASGRAEDKKENKPMVPAVLNFKVKTLDGKDADLARYQGKVVLFVNVASECGLTPQYKALQALHTKYAADGLVILGVPANEFGAQEPGTDAEIATFCATKYGVGFPMLAKVVVQGEGICPLYKFLTDKETNPKFAGDIKWNFTKFLVNRQGEVVARFEPRVEPDAKDVVEAIEAALKAK